ncbi:MAG: hypothetical protein KatS3mg010_0831 [Acidimicrobiia bacterium]|nr:MAG: hypothetical protein KatS3mg010_0831 [Acidimicrobiia bacterium]
MFAPVMVPPVDELVATIEAAFAELHARAGEVDVGVAQRLAAQAESLVVHAAGAMDRSGEWQREGFASAAALVRARCRMSHGGAAATTVKLARVCERMPALAGAFARGDVSRRHVAVIAVAATPERVDALAEVDGRARRRRRARHPARAAPPGAARDRRDRRRRRRPQRRGAVCAAAVARVADVGRDGGARRLVRSRGG